MSPVRPTRGYILTGQDLTAAATRFVEPCRTSPAAKSPTRLARRLKMSEATIDPSPAELGVTY